jgi:hypothetical protein
MPRIKIAAVVRATTRTRPPVNEYHRLSLTVSALLHVEPVTRTNVYSVGAYDGDRWIKITHQAHESAVDKPETI